MADGDGSDDSDDSLAAAAFVDDVCGLPVLRPGVLLVDEIPPYAEVARRLVRVFRMPIEPKGAVCGDVPLVRGATAVSVRATAPLAADDATSMTGRMRPVFVGKKLGGSGCGGAGDGSWAMGAAGSAGVDFEVGSVGPDCAGSSSMSSPSSSRSDSGISRVCIDVSRAMSTLQRSSLDSAILVSLSHTAYETIVLLAVVGVERHICATSPPWRVDVRLLMRSPRRVRGDVWLRTDDARAVFMRAVFMRAVFTRCADGARQACG